MKKMLFFLLGILLPSQLGKHFFLPFSYLSGVRIDYLAPTLYLIDCLLLMLIILHAPLLFRLIRKMPWWMWLCLFVPLFFAQVPPIALYRLLRIGEYISLFYIFYCNKKYVPSLLAGLFISTGYELVLALYQLLNGHAAGGMWYWLGERSIRMSTPAVAKASLQGTQILRPYGTFSHPNSLAGFYLLVAVFTLTNSRITNQIFKQSLFIVSCILICLSFSKAAIGVFILLYVLYSWKNWSTCKLCFFAKLTAIPTTAALFFFWQTDPLSLQKRIDVFSQSLAIISQYWATGVGWGNYLVAQNKFPIKYPYFFLQPVHNIFLLTLAEIGIPLSLILLWNGVKTATKIQFFKFEVLLPFLAIILTGMVDHYWVTLPQNSLLLAVIFGSIEYTEHIWRKK